MKLSSVIALCAVILAPAAAFAKDPAQRFTVMRPGDFNLTCEQLWNEAYAMRGIIYSTQMERMDSKMTGRGIGVVGTAASYLVGTVTGGLSIAAAGFAASQATENRAENAEEIQDIAHQRRALMVGVFGSKSCEGDISPALVDRKPVDPLEQLASMEPAAGTAGPHATKKPRSVSNAKSRDIDGDEDGENRTAGEILSRNRPLAAEKNGPYRPFKSKGFNP